MKKDENKGITAITYNYLNLPVKISFGISDKIEYLYNASGQKLQKKVTEQLGTKVTTTLYLNGFQYKNDVLSFFPHAEGYVNITVVSGNNTYSYVFNYTDHLGNIRMIYAQDPFAVNGIKILEENHYYPFGLKQTNYNSITKVFVEVSAELRISGSTPSTAINYKYKFQGQERQDELGLNWDSFKYRNYDYAIGRFMNIDPLTEEYNTWSPYVFSGNRVMDSRELEGLEPHSVHSSLAEAGKNFVAEYNGLSIRMKGEVGTKFYSTIVNGAKQYSYILPVGSPGAGAVDPESSPENIPKGSEYVGPGHTHKEDLNQIQYDENGKMISNESNIYSEQDLDVADRQNKENPKVEGSILGTPNGKVLMYTPTGKKDDARSADISRVSKEVPSDPNSKTRANNISPNHVPAVLPYGTSQQDVNNLPKL